MIEAPEEVVEVIYGHDRPRIAPPLPLRSKVDEYVTLSHALGIDLMPWQCNALRYMTATDASDRPLYREVAIVVARQNGKTTLLVPYVVAALRKGLRVMHTAQNRVLPRDVFEQVAEILTRAGVLKVKPRFANGQEVIKTRNGGIYRIVAPTRGGARGPSNDIVLIDELREMVDFGFIGAAKPTLTASKSPQMVYLSNAGTDESAVLNSLRLRSDGDPNLAYLEWSAAPERDAGDMEGWRESNPAMGHIPAVIDTLYAEHQANRLAGSMSVFETEHLCRWVISMDERLVQPEDWQAQEFGSAGRPGRPVMAVKMDIAGERAAAVVSWLLPDSRVALAVVADVTGSPIDVTLLGPALVAKATEWRASVVAFDPYTDTDLVRYFRRSEKVMGRDYANASEGFARRVADRKFVVDDEAGAIARDLEHTTRHHGERGTWIAVKSDQPNPVAEAAIRAAWLASKPSNFELARIY